MVAASAYSWLDSLGQLISVLVVFVLVLLLTWFVARWIAGYQKIQMQNQNLRIVETLKLSMNSYIQIIEIGDVYLVIAVSKDHVEKLTELSKEQFASASLKMDHTKGDSDDTTTGQGNGSFRDILDQVRHHLPKR